MKKIKVVLVEPKKQAKVVEIDHSLESMQEIVGGYIETFQLDDEYLSSAMKKGKWEVVNRVEQFGMRAN